MKKFLCILFCLVLSCGFCGCKKDSSAARIWIIQPSSIASETEIRQMIRNYDSSALISFVPANELNSRIAAASENDDCPNVFMYFTDGLPTMAENKKLADLSARISVSHVKADELLDSARRACLYQGKTYGVPMFCDVYMLATNRALMSVPPQNPKELSEKAAKLKDSGISPFEKLTPIKQSILFESLLENSGGSLYNSRKTKCAVNCEQGETAITDCAEYYKTQGEIDSVGINKSAFSVMTVSERNEISQKYPDTEITMSPLFGLNRLQTVSLCMSDSSANQKRDFEIIEFLYSKLDKLSAAYKCYSAKKEIKPLRPEDTDIVKYIAQATPSPDLRSYESLASVYIPSAIDKVSKGVNAADALNELVAL